MAKSENAKAIPRVGKIGKEWLRVRRKWVKDNPPDHAGYYYCYLCGRAMAQPEMTLDHVVPRSRRPDLRFSGDNLRPCCYTCNNSKGSKVYA